uniref:Uncharacterized protein n=1 Tax=Anguilla anguilla TaxID=7936 RepID=A0A0E9VLF0_ANGAN
MAIKLRIHVVNYDHLSGRYPPEVEGPKFQQNFCPIHSALEDIHEII